MSLSGKQVAIIGGGIGGLTAALAFKAQGARVCVLEQAEAIREVGAGIQVSPNGLRVFEALGLGDGFRDISLAAQAVNLRDYRYSRSVLRLDLQRLPREQSYRFVHRADLVELLAEHLRRAGGCLRLLQKVQTVQPGPRPTIVMRNGDTMQADLVVGADGVHSVLRPVLNGASDPFFTGQVAWRAVVPNVVDHPPEARVHMGPGRHLVSYPLRGGKSVNLVAVEERSDWAPEGWSHSDDPENLRRSFARFGGVSRRLLGQVDHCGLWGLFRHPVADHWFGENVAILGDAAHPTLPFMAQGAVMAIEDAWVLADALAKSADAGQGLRDYQARRHARVSRVIEAANGNAWKYHLRNPLIRSVAHLGMSALGQLTPGKMLHQFDWLYTHDVTQE